MGAAQSGSSIKDGQGEKVVKSRWQPRNGCDGCSMAKKFDNNNSGEFCGEAVMRIQINLTCCY